MNRIILPTRPKISFTCPHCGVLARHYKWGYELDLSKQRKFIDEVNTPDADMVVSECEHCQKHCIWVYDTYVYPDFGNAPQANPDMPPDVLAEYEEASRIYTKSPRGAAALLRLAIQKLMVYLGQPGKNINDDIAALVAKGLPVQIQQALDVVRVTGNNAVHPGQLNVDDAEIAEQLFPLINLIVEYQISLPARMQEMYEGLPDSAKQAIEKRDAQK